MLKRTWQQGGTVNPIDRWREEKRSAYLYRVIAGREKDEARRDLFLELARCAERQAAIWEADALKQGQRVPADWSPGPRARIAAGLIRSSSPRAVRPMLSAMKVRGLSVDTRARPTGAPSTPEFDVGHRHRGLGAGGTLRAAVFGINDGLVSNASLILGIAGASSDRHMILISGLAGLLAGAFSMAAGEYISMRSQREVYEYQIGLEREEIRRYPKEEAGELAAIYRARGLQADQAKRLAETLMADPERALDTLARDELGLDPRQLGSPWGAALSSFLSFAVGAIVPLAPFLISSRPAMLFVAVGLSLATLFGVGAVLSLFTGRNALWSGLRMMLIGGLAGGATYLIGRLLGVSLS
jgi:VIT1/CCC1 family predicted Fe2+/Mn2+ transporter